MIEPAVSSALAARHADRVANLAMLMANAGREHELEGLYIAARLPMLQVMTKPQALLDGEHHVQSRTTAQQHYPDVPFVLQIDKQPFTIAHTAPHTLL